MEIYRIPKTRLDSGRNPRGLNIHFPLGADMLSSPVIRALTETEDPPHNEEGGKIRTDVSKDFGYESSPLAGSETDTSVGCVNDMG